MSAIYWFMSMLFFLAVEAFFTMSEMSFVSFDRIRLNFLKSHGNKRAQMLSRLLEKPLFLFGSCLIGVNTALIVGSECSRQLYASLGLPVEIAPITQVILVVLFAELSPLLAARAHYQSVALFCVPIVYAISWIFSPVLLVISLSMKVVHKILGSSAHEGGELNRDELQHLIQKAQIPHLDEEDLDSHLVSNIFKLKYKKAKDILDPLEHFVLIPKGVKAKEAFSILEKNFSPIFLIYEKTKNHIIKVGHSRDLLQVDPKAAIETIGHSPWFVTEDLGIFELLSQLKKETLLVGIVLDQSGRAKGGILLEDVLDELFSSHPLRYKKGRFAMQRTLSADMSVSDFNTQYGAKISGKHKTLADVVAAKLGHPAREGETVRIDHFEFVVKEASVLSAKTLLVRSIRQ